MSSADLKIAALAEELAAALYARARQPINTLDFAQRVNRDNLASDARIVERIAADAARRYADAFVGEEVSS